MRMHCHGNRSAASDVRKCAKCTCCWRSWTWRSVTSNSFTSLICLWVDWADTNGVLELCSVREYWSLWLSVQSEQLESLFISFLCFICHFYSRSCTQWQLNWCSVWCCCCAVVFLLCAFDLLMNRKWISSYFDNGSIISLIFSLHSLFKQDCQSSSLFKCSNVN